MKMIWVKTKKERRIEDLETLVRVTEDLLIQAKVFESEIDKLTDLSQRERESFYNIFHKISKKRSDYEALLVEYKESTQRSA